MRCGINPPASPFQIIPIYERLILGAPPREVFIERVVKEEIPIDRPELVAELQRTAAENAELKRHQLAPRIQERLVEVEKIVEVPVVEFREMVVKELDLTFLALSAAIALMMGLFYGYLVWGR